MNNLSNLILPVIIFIIVFYAGIKKVDVYDSFIEGAKESFPLVINIFPCMLAMILAINIFLKSGILTFILNLIKVPFNIELISLGILRPLSSSAALATLNKIFTSYGPDSFIGFLGSIMQGSTDTTIYILALYFGSIGIKKIRYSLIVGLLADLIGLLISIFFANLFF